MKIKRSRRTMTPSSRGEKSFKTGKTNRRNFAYTAGILLFLCAFTAVSVADYSIGLAAAGTKLHKDISGRLRNAGARMVSINTEDTGADSSDVDSISVPYIGAESAVLIEGASGRVLYEKDKDKQLPPASTTKIMTALIAVEWAEDAEIFETKESETDRQLDQMIEISGDAAGAEGSSIYLEKGEKVSLRDLLYGMMLRSGNDAALAVAEGVAGDQKTFADMMNSRVRSLGLNNTFFKNPNGLNEEGHYSSAYDLAVIAREAMRHEIFRDLAGTKVWNASREGADNYNYFYNKNKTLFQYEGATGIKIGYTQAAGRCLVASAKRNGMELIAVVLNDHNWFEDVYSLFDYGFASYDNVKIAEAEEVMIHTEITGGEKSAAAVGAKQEIICPSLKGQKTDISLIYDLPKKAAAPISRWQKAGKLDIYSGENFVYSVPLFYMEDIDKKAE